LSERSHKNKPESQKSFETWASHQDNLKKRSFRWYIDCYDDSYVDAAYTGWRMGQENAEHKLKQRLAELEELSGVNSAQIKLLGEWLNARGKSMAELEADKAELLSFVLSLDHESITSLYFDVMTCGQMETLRTLIEKYKQPEKEQGS
jgi:hypothetical protein